MRPADDLRRRCELISFDTLDSRPGVGRCIPTGERSFPEPSLAPQPQRLNETPSNRFSFARSDQPFSVTTGLNQGPVEGSFWGCISTGGRAGRFGQGSQRRSRHQSRTECNTGASQKLSSSCHFSFSSMIVSMVCASPRQPQGKQLAASKSWADSPSP